MCSAYEYTIRHDPDDAALPLHTILAAGVELITIAGATKLVVYASFWLGGAAVPDFGFCFSISVCVGIQADCSTNVEYKDKSNDVLN